MTASDYQNLVKLCQALDEHGVEYLVFGSFAGRLQGADLETVDVDLVPEGQRETWASFATPSTPSGRDGASKTQVLVFGSTADVSKHGTSSARPSRWVS